MITKLKNRYGIANQVINCGFWGSVGWFTELPEPEQIKDYSIYQNEQQNIPCKNNVIIQSLSQNMNKIEDSVQKEPQKELNYHF